MSISTYTVPTNKIVHYTQVDISSWHCIVAPIHVVQYDNKIPIIAVKLRNNGSSYIIDTSSMEAWIRWKKPDGTFVRKKALGCNADKDTLYYDIIQQMVMCHGITKPVVELVIPAKSNGEPEVVCSSSFSVIIDKNPIQNGDIESTTIYEDPYKNVVYTKNEIDVKFADINKSLLNCEKVYALGAVTSASSLISYKEKGTVYTGTIAYQADYSGDFLMFIINSARYLLTSDGHLWRFNSLTTTTPTKLTYTAAEVESLLDDYDEAVILKLNLKADKATTLEGYGITDAYTKNEVDTELAKKVTNASFNELKNNLSQNGLSVFESYPYEWMYAIKDIQITDSSTLAIGYVKRTSTRNTIALYLVENGALSTVKLYANVDSDITGYATYSNSAKTVTMTVNWDEIPYDTVVQFNNNYVLCSAWCYGNTRLEYLLNKAKEEAVSYAENKTSSFESTGKADEVVSNVQIVGMNHTDARFLISNFNRHYNGDDTDLLYIYTTDDTGATANLITGVRVAEETGTITVDLSTIVSGAIIRFDYDFRGIDDGTRLQGTGTGFLVKKNCYILESVSVSDFENYEKKIPIDFGFFEKFAVIGDSYASGEIYVADSSQSKGYTVADYYQKSWGQILARKYGATCINLSVGGLTTRTWLTSSRGLTKMLAEEAQELYLCALGINDEISLGTSYIGTINDIKNYSSYSDYADTFYGNYGKIIEQIKEHAPKSKIVLMSIAYLYNATEDSFTAAIKNIADYYNIPFINIKDDAFYAKDSIYKTGQSYNHPTAPLYAGMAQANARLFCRCVANYYDYFKDFVG